MKMFLEIARRKLCFDSKCGEFVFKAWKHSSVLNGRVKEICDSSSERPSNVYTKQDGKLTLSSTLLLNDGNKIPRLGLGVFNVEEKQARRAVLWALEAGYRQIDTASRYKNEKSVGQAIRESGLPRSEIFVVTKVYRANHGYNETLAAFNKSLTKLGLEYVDMYLIHFPIPAGVVNTWRALVELRDKGLTRSIGVSNFNIHQLKALGEHTNIVPAVNQIEVNPYLQMPELVDYCTKNGIAVQAYSPLTVGHKLNDPPLRSIADRYNKTTAQILLRWSLQKGYICISKSSHKERIVDNAAVFDFEISQTDMDILEGFEENYRTGRDMILWPWEG